MSPSTELATLAAAAQAAENDLDERDLTDSIEDFTAFWAEQDRKGRGLSDVFGIDLVLPPSMPLAFDLEARRLAKSRSEDDTRKMVGFLFGGHALDRSTRERLDGQDLITIWRDRGMDIEQFGVLLAWGSMNLRGTTTTLKEARILVTERMAKEMANPGGDDTGKALTTHGGSSGNSGLLSKRTSKGNTRSNRRKSRR